MNKLYPPENENNNNTLHPPLHTHTHTRARACNKHKCMQNVQKACHSQRKRETCKHTHTHTYLPNAPLSIYLITSNRSTRRAPTKSFGVASSETLPSRSAKIESGGVHGIFPKDCCAWVFESRAAITVSVVVVGNDYSSNRVALSMWREI